MRRGYGKMIHCSELVTVLVAEKGDLFPSRVSSELHQLAG
jgi:hypothetical protein